MRAHSSPWYLVLSSYWFANSFKWFLMLLVLLPARVAELVPEAERASRLGLLFAIGAVMALVGPPVFGYLSDRLGKRMPFMAIGTILTAVALIWMAYAPSYGLLLLGYILLQLSDDLATGPYSALIPDLTGKRERGEASGWLGALQVGGQVAAGVVGFAVASLQWQFLIIALVNLLAAGLILSLVGEVPGLKPQSRNFLESVMAPWRNADFRWVWFTRFLIMLAQYIVQTYLQFYLADRVQTFAAFGRTFASEPFQAVALLGLLISVGAAMSAVPAGRMSDERGRKWVIYVSGIGLAVLMIPILLLPRYDVLIVLAVIFGLLYGAYVAVDWALVSDVLPNPQSHATDMGVWQTAIVLPQVLAGAFGTLLERFNQQSPGSGYTVIFLIAAVCFVLGTVLVRQIRGAK